MTTDRFWQTMRGNGVGVAAVLLLALLGRAPSARAQTGNAAAAAARSAVHPATTAAAAWEWYAGKSERNSAGAAPGGSAVSLLPVAFSGAGETLLSANVNVVTCRAVAGSGGDVWLGTALGIKRIEKPNGKPATVRHYTRRDGLPGDLVLAIAADADGASAWCLVSLAAPPLLVPLPPDRAPGALALCRWERRTNRWETLRRVAVPPTFAPNWSGPFFGGPLAQPARIVLSPNYVGWVLPRPAGLAPQQRRAVTGRAAALLPADGALLLWNRRAQRWRDVPWNEEVLDAAAGTTTRRFDNGVPLPAIRFAWVESSRNNLWLGTSAGLLRYNIPDRHWQRFLPGHTVCAGTVQNNTLYLATLILPAAVPGRAASDQSVVAIAGRFVRFSPQTSAVIGEEGWPASLPGETLYSSNNAYQNIDASCGVCVSGDGTVWIASPARPGDSRGYGDPARPDAAFFRRNARGQWSRRLAWRPDDYEGVPNAALFSLLPSPIVPAVALAPPPSSGYPADPSPLALALARRFPAWICLPEALPAEVATPISYDSPYRVVEAGGKTEWFVQSDVGQSVVVRRDKTAAAPAGASSGETRFPLPTVSVANLPVLRALAVAGDTILVAHSETVWAYNTVSGTWRRVNLPPGNWNSISLAAAGDGAVWINGRLRYDPATDQFFVRALANEDPNATRRVLLGAGAGGSLYLLGQGGEVWRTDLRGENVARMPADLPEALRPPNTSSNALPTALAVFGDVIWYRAVLRPSDAPKSDLTYAAVIGYDTRAQTWTPPVELKNYSDDARAILAGAGETAANVLTQNDSAAVQGYDARARRWNVVAPPLPADVRSPNILRLVSVDQEAVYLYDALLPGLRVYERRTDRWTVYPVELSTLMNATEAVAARHKNAIYVSTYHGLRRFDMAARIWKSLPIVRPQTFQANLLFGDEDAIWALQEPATDRGVPLAVARLNKASGTWQIWNQQHGLPDGDAYVSDRRIILGGKTVWLLNAGRVFRLSLAKNRWEEQTPAAGPNAATRRYVRAIMPGAVVGDNGSVWLLCDETVVHPAGAAARTDSWNLARDTRPAPFLWRWDEARETLAAVPRPADLPALFDDAAAGSVRLNTRLLLAEPGALFVGTAGNRVYCWNIAANSWRRVAPIGLASFLPERARRAAGSGGALWFLSSSAALRWQNGSHNGPAAP